MPEKQGSDLRMIRTHQNNIGPALTELLVKTRQSVLLAIERKETIYHTIQTNFCCIMFNKQVMLLYTIIYSTKIIRKIEN